MKELPEIQSLSISDRLELVSAIWNSIFHDLEQLPISSELRQELDRELAAHRLNPGSSISWEDADRDIFGRE